jgi:hypothetical protein
MPWMLIIVIVGALAGGFCAYMLWRAWNWTIPPEKPSPLITAATAISGHAIRLTLNKGVGPVEVEVERTIPTTTSTFSLFTLSDTLDDTGLVPDTLYEYRTRYANPQSPWSYTKRAKTLVNALLEGELTGLERDWQGYCLIQRFEAFVLSRSGNLVSITLRVPQGGLSIERIYISQVDPSPGADPYDSITSGGALHDTPLQPALVVPSSSLNQSRTVTLPAIPYVLDHTRPLLIAMEFSSTPNSEIMYKEVPPGKAVAYFKRQEPLQSGEEPEARKTDRDAYLRWPTDTTMGGIYLIEMIEVGERLD